ncbi:MAG: response regulator [Brevibacterium aurantiacum]|uniref:DNA-binding response regulator n=2 Tax=Micrococcales TaxID=85006 RepID=A0A2A3YPE2_BREAU|nr:MULTISPECIES: response regulator transcription factor [Micrococcales]MDN5586603.1 response regulator transcription factor [Brevibacterium sp.]PCC41216.1 DNA-binding response regulator [Brevibacterium aurantiacum]RCS75624.1 DNA-binding response regulator [Brachybacterium alimentarium]
MTIRLLLVDDQEMVRAGLRMVLGSRSEFDIVGEAENGIAAVDLARSMDADVVLMDVRMPLMNGVEATAAICESEGPRVLILTTFDLDEYVYDALRAGASGFILKEAPIEELVSAIVHVHRGDAVVAPSTTRRLIEHFSTNDQENPIQVEAQNFQVDMLSEREIQVLKALSQGMSNAEVAAELFIAENTVKTHVRRILTKLDLRDRVQAVVFAYNTGIVGRR